MSLTGNRGVTGPHAARPRASLSGAPCWDGVPHGGPLSSSRWYTAQPRLSRHPMTAGSPHEGWEETEAQRAAGPARGHAALQGFMGAQGARRGGAPATASPLLPTHHPPPRGTEEMSSSGRTRLFQKKETSPVLTLPLCEDSPLSTCRGVSSLTSPELDIRPRLPASGAPGGRPVPTPADVLHL